MRWAADADRRLQLTAVRGFVAPIVVVALRSRGSSVRARSGRNRHGRCVVAGRARRSIRCDRRKMPPAAPCIPHRSARVAPCEGASPERSRCGGIDVAESTSRNPVRPSLLRSEPGASPIAGFSSADFCSDRAVSADRAGSRPAGPSRPHPAVRPPEPANSCRLPHRTRG